MGAGVGDSVGDSVGDEVGAVGAGVGDSVGARVGDSEGAAVGDGVGAVLEQNNASVVSTHTVSKLGAESVSAKPKKKYKRVTCTEAPNETSTAFVTLKRKLSVRTVRRIDCIEPSAVAGPLSPVLSKIAKFTWLNSVLLGSVYVVLRCVASSKASTATCSRRKSSIPSIEMCPNMVTGSLNVIVKPT